MDDGKSMSEIIGYLNAKIFIAKVELSSHLEVYGQPTKERIEEILAGLEKTLEKSEVMWNNRIVE